MQVPRRIEPQKIRFFLFPGLARLRRRVLGPQELCVWYVEEPRRVHISCFWLTALCARGEYTRAAESQPLLATTA